MNYFLAVIFDFSEINFDIVFFFMLFLKENLYAAFNSFIFTLFFNDILRINDENMFLSFKDFVLLIVNRCE